MNVRDKITEGISLKGWKDCSMNVKGLFQQLVSPSDIVLV